jgi:NAD+ synthase (glutamine-hydrolysing)
VSRSGLRLALCQINPTVGDLSGNARLIEDGIERARAAGAELALFGELALTGYPPEDLLLREHFLVDTGAALHRLAATATGLTAIVGFPERGDGGLHNAAAVLAEGEVKAIYRKVHLPNYGVFDEQRYFKAGHGGVVVEVAGVPVGVTVCEDLWIAGAPATEEAKDGARLIVNISASPYHAGKGLERERLFAARARETGVPIVFCGLVGGQDELVFDGHSFVLDPDGRTIARASQFRPEVLVCDVEVPSDGLEGGDGALAGAGRARPASVGRSRGANAIREPISREEAEVYEALKLGLRDYVVKNGFSAVVLGLSGGIDSALVACLAVDALGADRVNVAVMPSPYSSIETQADARALAAALGAGAHELAIEPAMAAYEQILAADFAGLPPDLAEENIQARIRGNLLMALSNKFGWLVLATGNKSEMSVGYSTLYGDLAGGFAVIKDVPKTLVFRLARWRNAVTPTAPDGESPGAGITLATPDRGSPGAGTTAIPSPIPTPVSSPIPQSILDRAPSAELRADQRDQDSLPPYDLLDEILHGYIELDRSREQLIAEGLPAEEVERTTRMVDHAEYKRRQAPPGIKITERAFGRDRRMPITNAYRG